VSALRIAEARNGQSTAFWNGRHLHSRFDPRTEARRFVAELTNDAPALVVVIGPGLGHCFAAIRATLAHTRTVAIALNDGLARAAIDHADASWRPGCGIELSRFLDREIEDVETASFAVLEWKPVIDSFPVEADRARTAVAAHLRRSQASLLTRGASGRRWLRNRIHNFLHVAAWRPASSDRRVSAIVVAAAGPSLERALPVIRAARERVDLWVTASALDAVTAAGLIPDLVVVTDTAVYAHEHLRSVIIGPLSRVPVAAPLSSTRGLASCSRVVVFSEGPEDDTLIAGIGRHAPLVRPHGTVTTTALAFARSLSTAPLVAAGADFAWQSGRSHVRPHLSIVYRRTASKRLLPETTILAPVTAGHSTIREEWSTDRTLSTYAAWFREHAPARFAPLFALEPSPALAGTDRIDAATLLSLPALHPSPGWEPAGWPDRADRREQARVCLRTLIDVAERSCPSERPADLPRTAPAYADLAGALALPDLIGWVRASAGRSSYSAEDAWERARRTTVNELNSALENV
jgi:hypothetical protein